MANRFPSLDQYVPQPPQASPPPPAYGNQGDYPAPNNYAHPAPEYTQTYNPPPPSAGGNNYGDQNKIPANNATPQAGLFQDMGFLQDAVYSQVSSRLLDNGRQYVDRNFGRFMTLSPLKYYFNVNNKYVFNKLRLLFFPFLHKNWARTRSAHSDLHEAVPPREDINAPDLYIPVMAFVTYILLVGFLHGTSLKFTPEVLGMTATTGLVVLLLEICFIKFSFYLLNTRSVPFLDLLSYCGYIFVGLILNIFSSLAINTYSNGLLPYIAPVYTGLCMAYFMLRTLSPAVPDMNGLPKTKTYLLIVAALQVLIIFFLGLWSW